MCLLAINFLKRISEVLMLRSLAIIPARGGSKRLPRKNVMPFRGQPILAYTVKAALETKRFAKVILSTEDPEIAEAGRNAGAEVIMRPEELASDNARISEVCQYHLREEEQTVESYDIITCLYATAPLRSAQDIIGTLDLIEPGVCDYAMAVTEYSHYAHKAMTVDGQDNLKPLNPELFGMRGSEVGTVVAGNGSTYVARCEAFRETGKFFGEKLRGYQMPRERSVDIDSADDLDLANYFAEKISSAHE